MLLNLHEELTQATHASWEVKLIQHSLHSAKPGNNRLLDHWGCLGQRLPWSRHCTSAPHSLQYSFLNVNTLGVTFVICHLCVFYSGEFLGHIERLHVWYLELTILWGYSKWYDHNFPKQLKWTKNRYLLFFSGC